MDLSFISYYLVLNSTKTKTQKIGHQYHFWAKLKNEIKFKLVLSEFLDILVISAKKSGKKFIQTFMFEKYNPARVCLEPNQEETQPDLFTILVSLMMNLDSIHVWGFRPLKECQPDLKMDLLKFFKTEIERITAVCGRPSKTWFSFESRGKLSEIGFRKFSSDFAIGIFQPEDGENQYLLDIPSEKYHNIFRERAKIFLNLITWCWNESNPKDLAFAKWCNVSEVWGLPDEKICAYRRVSMVMPIHDQEFTKVLEKGQPFLMKCAKSEENGKSVWKLSLKTDISKVSEEPEEEEPEEDVEPEEPEEDVEPEEPEEDVEPDEEDEEEEESDEEEEPEESDEDEEEDEEPKKETPPEIPSSDPSDFVPSSSPSELNLVFDNGKTHDPKRVVGRVEETRDPKRVVERAWDLNRKILERFHTLNLINWGHFEILRTQMRTLVERIINTHRYGASRSVIVLFGEVEEPRVFNHFGEFGFSVETHIDQMYRIIRW